MAAAAVVVLWSASAIAADKVTFLTSWFAQAEHGGFYQAKATGLYMIGTLSKHKAEAEGFQDALMLDWRGRVSESTGANIFLVMDGELTDVAATEGFAPRVE